MDSASAASTPPQASGSMNAPSTPTPVQLAWQASGCPSDPEPYATLDEVVADVTQQWNTILGTGKHPVEWLQEAIPNIEAKKCFAKNIFGVLDSISPNFKSKNTSRIDADEAMNPLTGASGSVSILALGWDRIPGSRLSCFWRGFPASEKIRQYMVTAITSGQGLDTVIRPHLAQDV